MPDQVMFGSDRKRVTRKTQIVEGQKLFMDLLVIDLKHEKAYVFGYDGELTMKIPSNAFWHIVETYESGSLGKQR